MKQIKLLYIIYVCVWMTCVRICACVCVYVHVYVCMCVGFVSSTCARIHYFWLSSVGI